MNSTIDLIVQKSHATIVEIPKGYGFDFAIQKFNIPHDVSIFKISPRIHNAQKTKTINTDDILEIQQKISLTNKKNQYFVFEDAEKMNETAQNKFLKIFEEPKANIKFILLTNSSDNLLPTIRSRAQIVRIPKISTAESIKLLKKYKFTEEKNRQILFLADGLPAEIEELSNNEKYFESEIIIAEMAKKWFIGSKFDKITIISQIKNDREKALRILELILKIINQTFGQNPKLNAVKAKKILSAYEAIAKNGNIKICLLSAVFV